MTDSKTFTNANRLAWNAAALVHQKHRGDALRRDFAQAGHSVLDDFFVGAIHEAGLANARIAHLCCNNGVELLSALNLGAGSGVGFDISDVAIAEATELAQIAGRDATFICTDVYDIGPEHDGQYDQVWFTIGGLTWLPDLARILHRAAAMLRVGGSLVIYDMHPLTTLLAVPGEPAYKDPMRLEYDYFSREPLVSTKGIDYVGHTEYESPPSYDFQYTLSMLLNAIAQAGLVLRRFEEYPHDISNIFGHLAGQGRVPLTILLRAEKG